MRSSRQIYDRDLLEQMYAETERESRAFLTTMTIITLVTLAAILLDAFLPGRPF